MIERIVFFGRNKGYAVTLLCFRELLKYVRGSKHQVVAVVSDDNHGMDCTLEKVAKKNGINWLSVESNDVNNASFIAKIAKFKPTLFVVVQFPRIFGARLLRLPKRGSFNLHRGWPLRGGSIDERAIYCQLPMYNLVLHHMNGGIDTGNIVGRMGFTLDSREDGYSLVEKSDKTGCAAFRRYLLPLIGNRIPRGRKQDLKKTIYGAKESISGEIDLSMSSDKIERLCRAFYHPRKSPAFIRIAGRKVCLVPPIKIISRPASAPAGTVISLNKSLGVLATGDSMIAVSKCCVGLGMIEPFGGLLVHSGIRATGSVVNCRIKTG